MPRSATIQGAKQETKEQDTEEIVTYTLEELAAMPLEEVAQIPDKEIDYSDIPKLDDEFWANAVAFYPKPPKELVTIRLDADVLEYFRQPGPGYQTRINAVLRLWMKAHPVGAHSSPK